VYLTLKIAVTATLLAAVIAFNFLVDPYGIYLPDHSFEFSRNKTEFFMKEPIIKPFRVSDLAPDTVILGASSAGLGYDEDHAAFAGQSVYNFSMAGSSMYMIYRSFQHALAQGNLRRVVLDLSLVSFNEYHNHVTYSAGNVFDKLLSVRPDGERNWFAPLQHVALVPQFLMSWRPAIHDSIATLRKQGPYDGWRLDSRGGWRGATLGPSQSQGQRFMVVERHALGGYFKDNSPQRRFSIYSDSGAPSRAFGYFERLIGEAMDHDLDVVLVLSPSHVYFYEALQYQGLMPQFSAWKRQLVEINERMASERGRPPYPLWDFARISPLTTEPVPSVADKATRMRWYYDPMHFTRATGDEILDQVYLGQAGPGVLLDADNVEQEEVRQQAGMAAYRRENPLVVGQLQAMFRQVSGREPQ